MPTRNVPSPIFVAGAAGLAAGRQVPQPAVPNALSVGAMTTRPRAPGLRLSFSISAFAAAASVRSRSQKQLLDVDGTVVVYVPGAMSLPTMYVPLPNEVWVGPGRVGLGAIGALPPSWAGLDGRWSSVVAGAGLVCVGISDPGCELQAARESSAADAADASSTRGKVVTLMIRLSPTEIVRPRPHEMPIVPRFAWVTTDSASGRALAGAFRRAPWDAGHMDRADLVRLRRVRDMMD